jgi:hypothetical protein
LEEEKEEVLRSLLTNTILVKKSTEDKVDKLWQ